MQQAIQNSLVTAQEEESRRAQPQPRIQQNRPVEARPADGEYRDNDYRLAGNIVMDLSRANENPSRDVLIAAWKNRIGITQAQAERIYNDMFE